MKEKLIWLSTGVIAGSILAYFFIPHVPDIKIVTETRVAIKTARVNKNTITDREIIKYKDGTEKIVERIVNHDVIKEKEVTKESLKEKTVNYSGSIYFLWYNLEYLPSDIGINYVVFSPLYIVGEYEIKTERIKIGAGINF